MKKCPFCAEEIQDEAIKCKHCGSLLTSESKVTVPNYATPKLLASNFLIAGEKIFLELRPAKRMFFMGAILFLVIALFTVNLPSAPFFFGLFAFALIVGWLKYQNAVYALTDKRIIATSGIFWKKVTQVPINKVQDFHLKTPFLSDYGKILFNTAGSSGIEMVWDYLKKPKEIYKKVSDVLISIKA